jgi:hypothetical protein
MQRLLLADNALISDRSYRVISGSVMPRLMMVDDLLRGTLRVVPLPIASRDRPAGLILPRDRALTRSGLTFAGCLRAYVAEIVERVSRQL